MLILMASPEAGRAQGENFSRTIRLGDQSAGKWYKVGQIEISNRYSWLNLSGTVSTMAGSWKALYTTELSLRVKQQAAFGNDPHTEFIVSSYPSHSPFKAILTSNNPTVIELYKKSPNNYSYLTLDLIAHYRGNARFVPVDEALEAEPQEPELEQIGHFFLAPTGNGRVGIGTPNDPEERLHVEGYGRFGRDEGHLRIGHDSVNARIDNFDGGDLLINWAGNGDVSIGTQENKKKNLKVGGNLIIQGHDLVLGSDDDRPKGDRSLQRALVHGNVGAKAKHDDSLLPGDQL